MCKKEKKKKNNRNIKISEKAYISFLEEKKKFLWCIFVSFIVILGTVLEQKSKYSFNTIPLPIFSSLLPFFSIDADSFI